MPDNGRAFFTPLTRAAAAVMLYESSLCKDKIENDGDLLAWAKK